MMKLIIFFSFAIHRPSAIPGETRMFYFMVSRYATMAKKGSTSINVLVEHPLRLAARLLSRICLRLSLNSESLPRSLRARRLLANKPLFPPGESNLSGMSHLLFLGFV
jgi:hypothetical protein